MSRYSIVDIETTGGNRDGNKITEVAIINVDDGVVTEEWSSLIYPERPIPWGITKLTGIDDAMVADAPPFYKLAKKIVELTEGRTFVAHNAFFDYRFLQKEFSELGYTFQREVLCTVRLARAAFPGLPSYSLSNLSKHFRLNREAEHRALDDTRACYEIFRRVQEKSADIIEAAKPKPLPPELDDGSIEKLPEAPGNYFFYTRAGLLLYVGKAKNIRDRVKSHFQSAGNTKRDIELRTHVAKIDFKLWGSDELASLMELHYIKALRPLMNRASRKVNFRYTLSLHPQAAPGSEVRVSTTADEDVPRFGSRKMAEEARAKVYQAAFAVEADGLFFVEKMRQYRTVLGDAAVAQRLAEKIYPHQTLLTENDIALPGRTPKEQAFVIVREGRLIEVQLVDEQGEVEIYPLEDYPDMRRIVAKFTKSPR
jgi:DNA polymerase III epsilon subunit family exonuclease